MKVVTQVELDAPPEVVFDVLLDLDRLGEWVTAHEDVVEQPDEGLEVGSEFRQRLKVTGFSFKVSWELVALERPSLIEWKAKGPGGSKARALYELSAISGGTRFDYLNEFELPGGRLSALAGNKIGEKQGREEAERSLANLKRMLGDG